MKTRNRRIANSKSTSRFIKFLSVAPSGQVVKSVLKASPDPVIKTISNAALNAIRGDVALTPNQKKLFRANQKLFKTLVSPSISVSQKRNSLVSQKGGAFPLIPILIGAVLGSLGAHFLGGKTFRSG